MTMCVCFWCMIMTVDVYGGEKRIQHLELELLVVASPLKWALEKKVKPSARAIQVLKY